MLAVPDIQAKLLKKLNSLRQAVNHLEPLLKQIGALVTKECRRAFDFQRLGDIAWPERYPGQEAPTLNIAGALADFIGGRMSPKPNRFEDRPALVDEGNRGGLKATITWSVRDGNTVQVGTNKTYAKLHQEGGISIQNYGKDTRERIANWLFTKKSKSVRGYLKKAPRKGREGYVKHLGPLLTASTHMQRVIRRPFIGVTDKTEEEIRRAVVLHFSRVR